MNRATNTGLDTETIGSLAKIFTDTHGVNEVLIFGSRAKGNFSPGSDIDVAVSGENLTIDTVLEMMSEIDSLGLLYKVDIHRLDRITDVDLLEHIQRAGKVLWRRE